MTSEFAGSSSGIADPAVHVTNGALIWNGSAWVNALINPANIAADAVTAAAILAGAVGTAELGTAAVTDAKVATGIGLGKLAQGGASTGQVLTWNGSVWAAASPSGGAPSAHQATHEPAGSDAIDWSGTIHKAGVESSRPAASSANAGTVYYATDTLTVWRSTGSAWQLIAWNPAQLLYGGNTYSTLRERVDADTNMAAGTSGVAYAHAVVLPKDAVIGFIGFILGSTGATFSAGSHYWFGIYDPGGNLVAYTADQGTAAWGANTWKELALAFNGAGGAASTYTVPSTGVYQLVAMVNVNGGTMPTRRGHDVLVNAMSTGNSNMVTLAQSFGSALGATPPSTIASPSTETKVWLGYART